MRAQVATSAPTEAQLVELLLFVETHHGLTSEYDEHQHHLAKLLDHQPLTEGLREASTMLLHRNTTLPPYAPTKQRSGYRRPRPGLGSGRGQLGCPARVLFLPFRYDVQVVCLGSLYFNAQGLVPTFVP